MRILSKREFNALSIDSLFSEGGTITEHKKEKLDTGKYKKSIIGKDVPAHISSGCKAIWAEARQDRNGTYYQLYCV